MTRIDFEAIRKVAPPRALPHIAQRKRDTRFELLNMSELVQHEFGVERDNQATLTLERGKLVSVQAGNGEGAICQLVKSDEGASRLSEIALVPVDAPLAASGLVYFDTLLDETAASHIAVGAAYRSTLENGDSMSDSEFRQSGGNVSAVHVDLMIGSESLNVDGVRHDGTVESVMESGKWAFDIDTR